MLAGLALYNRRKHSERRLQGSTLPSAAFSGNGRGMKWRPRVNGQLPDISGTTDRQPVADLRRGSCNATESTLQMEAA